MYQLQRLIQGYLTSGEGSALELIAGEQPQHRLDIYARAYRLRLGQSLLQHFPKLHLLLGDVTFAELTDSYIVAHPSQSPNIRWFGHRLAEFLRATPPFSAQSVLGEMATFEWALAKAFDAADGPRSRVEALSGVPPEQWADMRFALHSSVQILNLSWNVPPLWSQLEARGEVGEPVASATAVSWLVWRKPDFKHYWRSLAVDEAWALDAADRGSCFGDICEGMERWIDAQHIALRAAGLLKQWLQDGVIAELRFGPPNGRRLGTVDNHRSGCDSDPFPR